MPIDPKLIARIQADRSRRQLLAKRLSEEQSESEGESLYLGYDADAESHLIVNREVKSIRQLLTNAGLAIGDPVAFTQGAEALDSTPRIRQPDDELPPIYPGTTPTWGALIRCREFAGTVTAYSEPVAARYTDPVPASWFISFMADFSRPSNFGSWSTSALPRYIFGRSPWLCASSATSLYDSYDPYCRFGLLGWNFRPPTLYYGGSFGFGQTPGYCHLDLYNPNIGRFNSIVIASYAFSPDGVDALPTVSPTDLPRIYNRLPGVLCSTAHGSQIDMQWYRLETTKMSDYVPPQLDRPAFPGGITEIDTYKTTYSVLTDSGLIRVAEVLDQFGEGFTSAGTQRAHTALLSATPGGVLSLDLKIVTQQQVGDPIRSVEHYEIAGGVVSQVDTSRSWRRNWANTTSETPLPYTSEQSPCLLSYLTFEEANIDEAKGLIYLSSIPTLAELTSGTAVEVSQYDANTITDQGIVFCSIENLETLQVDVQATDVLNQLDIKDRETCQVIGFVYVGAD